MIKTSVIACALLCWQGVGWAGCASEHSMNSFERMADRMFNDGKETKRKTALAAECEVKNKTTSECLRRIRSSINDVTLVLNGPFIDDTEAGFEVSISGHTDARVLIASCYASSSGEILKINIK